MDAIRLAVALILFGVNLVLIYWFQHYVGINGIEWLAWIGYGLGSGFLTAMIKDVVRD